MYASRIIKITFVPHVGKSDTCDVGGWQHWEPGEGVRRGGGGERDGEDDGVHGNAERAAEKGVGKAERRVREGCGVRTRYDAKCPKSHNH